MKKKLLIIGAIHGDERIGPDAVAILKRKGLGKYFDFVLGNPRAWKEKKRFCEIDLNRSFPGRKYSRIYEERRAFEIFSVAKKYQYVIDVHEARCGKGFYMIAAREKIGGKFPVEWVDMDKILLWPNPKGASSELLGQSIELEFVIKKDRKEVTKQAVEILEKFIRKMENLPTDKINNQKRGIYYVYGSIDIDEARKSWKKLKDFKATKYQEEDFIPLLVGQYLKYGVVCYKMKKL